MKSFSWLLLFSLLFVTISPKALAVDPGAAEDERAAREKLLKAADQMDMIQANSEALRTEVDTLKTQLATIQQENSGLRQEIAELKGNLEKMDTARTKEREVLLTEVGKMVGHTKPTPAVESQNTSDEAVPPSIKHTEHGFYHVVEKGETLYVITQAYRDKGVKVTVAEIRKANALSAKAVLKVGQKLFIPKE